MVVSKRCRKFHDPWGNKYGNRCGAVVRCQYMVAKAELRTAHVKIPLMSVDASKAISHQYDRFVMGPYSVEAVRR